MTAIITAAIPDLGTLRDVAVVAACGVVIVALKGCRFVGGGRR